MGHDSAVRCRASLSWKAEVGAPMRGRTGLRARSDVVMIGEVRCRLYQLKSGEQKKSSAGEVPAELSKSELSFAQHDVGITFGCFLHEGM